MPITTRLPLASIVQTQDPDICDALARLRTPPIVEEVQARRKAHWWSRRRPQTRYSVLWPLGETLLGPEWQLVNFYQEPPHTSINTVVPKALVLAYLYGCSVTRSHEERTP